MFAWVLQPCVMTDLCERVYKPWLARQARPKFLGFGSPNNKKIKIFIIKIIILNLSDPSSYNF